MFYLPLVSFSDDLGAVPVIQHCIHCINYASYTMTDTESQYVQIKKEALAFTWACKNISYYILGKHLIYWKLTTNDWSDTIFKYLTNPYIIDIIYPAIIKLRMHENGVFLVPVKYTLVCRAPTLAVLGCMIHCRVF